MYLDSLKATYSAKGTAGVFVTVAGGVMQIVGATGQVCIGVYQWEATKKLADEAIAHYQAIKTGQEEDTNGD